MKITLNNGKTYQLADLRELMAFIKRTGATTWEELLNADLRDLPQLPKLSLLDTTELKLMTKRAAAVGRMMGEDSLNFQTAAKPIPAKSSGEILAELKELKRILEAGEPPCQK